MPTAHNRPLMMLDNLPLAPLLKFSADRVREPDAGIPLPNAAAQIRHPDAQHVLVHIRPLTRSRGERLRHHRVLERCEEGDCDCEPCERADRIDEPGSVKTA